MLPRKIAIGADHAGYRLKEAIKLLLHVRHIEVEDCGPHDSNSVDYPDYAAAVARLVGSGRVPAGILICGTGIGMAIAANKFKGVRAAVVHNLFTARMAAAHNHANILCLGARVLEQHLAEELVEAWLEERQEGDRHQRRIDKIAALEKEQP